MKIGFDGKRAFCNERGLGNYSRTLIDQLVEFAPENQYVLFTPEIKKNILNTWENGKKLKTVTPQNYFWKTLHPLWRSFELTNVIKHSQLDLYHGLSHELPSGIEKLKIKKIVTIHDLIFIRYPEYFPWLDRQVYKKKFEHSSRVADLVIAIGEQTKRDIIEFLKIPEEKIRVHYQSCDPRFYQLANKAKCEDTLKKYGLHFKKFILNVGAFEERKNQKNLIKAYSLLYRDNPECKLVLVGKGNQYLKECQELVRELGLTHSIYFLTGISMSELHEIYSGAKVFCFPSFFEGFGIPLIEAMFSKVPVVTSFGSCFPEVAGPDSFYADPYRPEDLARSLKEVLALDEQKISELTSRSWEHVQRFHRKNTTSQLLEYYSQLVCH